MFLDEIRVFSAIFKWNKQFFKILKHRIFSRFYDEISFSLILSWNVRFPEVLWKKLLFYYKLSTNSHIFPCPLAKFVLNRCPVTKFAYIWRSLDEIRISPAILSRNSHFLSDSFTQFEIFIDLWAKFAFYVTV